MNDYACNVIDLTDNPTAKSVVTNQLTSAPLSIALLFDLNPHDPTVIILDSLYTNGFHANEKKSLALIISLLKATADKLELQLKNTDSDLDFSEGDEFIIWKGFAEMGNGVTYTDISIPEGFIANYLRYTSKQESPTQFHFWSAVSMLSASIGRSITLRRGFYDLYPNFIIILVAGSALSRKSSAINVGIRLLRTAIQRTKEEGLGSGLTSVLGSKMTPEALCRAISLRGVDSLDMDYEELPAEARGRPVLLFNSELGVFLSKQAQMNGMVDLLTDLYDCPDVWEYITKTQGTDIAHNVYLSLLSATTPDWLASNVSSAVFNQGFTGRTVFVFANKPQHRNAHPTLSKEERLLESSLINFLQSKFNLEGEMVLSPGAHQLFEDWYMTREESIDSTMETGFFGREHDHVLKLAMVLSLSRSNTLTIELDDIDIAIKHLNIIRRDLVNVFEDVRVAGEAANVAIVEDAIKRAGASGVARSPLLRAVYRKVSKREFDEALDVLKLAGKINVDEISTGGRSKRIYKYK